MPDGLTEDDNVVEREVGERPRFDFEPRDHVELGESLGIFDQERAAKTSGSRFVYLTGPGRDPRAGAGSLRDRLRAQDRFQPVVPPVLVRRHAMYGTGFLPAEEHEFYRDERDELYLVGTSEVPLAAMHSDEILPEDAACPFATPVTRRASAARPEPTARTPRDWSGCTSSTRSSSSRSLIPDSSWDEYQLIRENQEAILQALEIPYRVLVMCAGDLGGSAAKKVDHEAWLPGGRAIHGGHVRDERNRLPGPAPRHQDALEGREPFPPHAQRDGVRGAARTIVALLENHQRADGSVSIPRPCGPTRASRRSSTVVQ